MGDALNPRESAVLAAITRNIRSKGYPPSVREIGDAVGLLSSSTVHGYLRRLEEKGYLRRDVAKPRAMEVIGQPSSETVHLPVFGRLVPEKPLRTEENRRGTFILPRSFLGEGSFFVVGIEEETGDGFLPGDMLIVREQTSAREGDVVLATSDGTACVICAYSEDRGDGLTGKLVALVRRIG